MEVVNKSTRGKGCYNSLEEVKYEEPKRFTLIELMAVMVIMGVMFGVFSKKYSQTIVLATNAAAIDSVVKLNTMETVSWLVTLLNHEYNEDSNVLENEVYDPALGPRYIWQSRSQTGGTLLFDGSPIQLIRQPSTLSAAGRWSFT